MLRPSQQHIPTQANIYQEETMKSRIMGAIAAGLLIAMLLLAGAAPYALPGTRAISRIAGG
jgi:hypothetical protein